MKHRLFVGLLTIFILVTLFSGCASSDKAYSKEANYYEEATEDITHAPMPEMDMAAMDIEKAESFSGSDGEIQLISTNRKLIYYADYQIETTNFDTDYELIIQKTASVNGYIQNSYIDGQKPTKYGDRGRYATLSLRIPSDQYGTFTNAINGIGTILSKSQNTDDVSAQYFDTESRIEVVSTKIERLQAILENTQDMTDIVTLENELSDSMYELDRLQGQKRQLDSLIDYSTITINLNEKNEIARMSEEEQGFSKRITKAFESSVDGFLLVIETLIIIIVGGIPVWIIVGLIVFLIIRSKRKKNQKRQKEESKKNDKGDKK